MGREDADDGLLTASFLGLSLGLTAIGSVALVDGWRPAVLVGLAGAAIAATRVRYSEWVAVVVLTALATLTLAGLGLGA